MISYLYALAHFSAEPVPFFGVNTLSWLESSFLHNLIKLMYDISVQNSMCSQVEHVQADSLIGQFDAVHSHASMIVYLMFGNNNFVLLYAFVFLSTVHVRAMVI